MNGVNTFLKEETITEEESDDVDLNDDTIVVSCGSLTGLLHMSKFLCPGIRQPCIQIGAETELISPKDFTIRANKDRQKDWKGSIRMGRNSVRTLMETKKLDFYNHATFCSAKCQSRNYITPKEISDNMLPSSMRRQSLPARTRQKNDDLTLEDILKIPEFSHLLKMNEGSAEEKKDEANNSLKEILKKPPILENATSAEVEELCKKMNSDPVSFWGELINMNVADEIIDQMISSLNTMRSKLKYGNINNVAPFLSRSVSSLGMNERVRNSINWRKTHLRTLRLNESGTSFIPRKPILGEILPPKLSPPLTSPPSTSVRSSIDFSSLEEPGNLLEIANNKSRKRSLPYKFDGINNEPLLKKEDLLQEQVEVKKEIEFEPKDSFEIDTTNILLMNQSQSSQDLLMQIAASIGEST